MGNVSTRVSVTDKEREAILKEAKIRAEQAKQEKISKAKMPTLSVDERKKKSREQSAKTPAKRRKTAA
jgi:hypothetical protein